MMNKQLLLNAMLVEIVLNRRNKYSLYWKNGANIFLQTMCEKMFNFKFQPIETPCKQVLQSGVLWQQNASNCHKYDIVSIFRG